MNINPEQPINLLIKEKARELGFDLCGIARSKPLSEHEAVLKEWTEKGMNGEMGYLGQNIPRRINPELLVPGAKTVIVTGLNYYSDKRQLGNNVPIISRYAYGADYHDVIMARLSLILDFIKEKLQNAEGRVYVDSAPVLEKAWGREAGIGWPGRHSVLINKKIGSFFFLGIIILNVEMDYDEPSDEDPCSHCSICIDSCPTGAINDNRTIDARKCISYLTVESKSSVPEEFIDKLGGRVFGCDRCQEVCPWNRRAVNHAVPEFELSDELRLLPSDSWKNFTREEFNRIFKKSAIKRRTYDRFMKNVTNVTKLHG